MDRSLFQVQMRIVLNFLACMSCQHFATTSFCLVSLSNRQVHFDPCAVMSQIYEAIRAEDLVRTILDLTIKC